MDLRTQLLLVGHTGILCSLKAIALHHLIFGTRFSFPTIELRTNQIPPKERSLEPSFHSLIYVVANSGWPVFILDFGNVETVVWEDISIRQAFPKVHCCTATMSRRTVREAEKGFKGLHFWGGFRGFLSNTCGLSGDRFYGEWEWCNAVVNVVNMCWVGTSLSLSLFKGQKGDLFTKVIYFAPRGLPRVCNNEMLRRCKKKTAPWHVPLVVWWIFSTGLIQRHWRF